LEWDRELYVEEDGSLRAGISWGYGLIAGTANDCEYFMNRIDAVDIWNRRDGNGLYGKTIAGLNGGQPLDVNNFWFAHPGYFIHHLESAGLIDSSFNPYEGRAISRFWRDTAQSPPVDLPERVNVVKDNPGFAPIWEAPPEGNFDFRDAPFESNVPTNRRFADPTSLFNNRNSHTEPTRRHGGVDFRGRSPIDVDGRRLPGKEIVSFIHGRVINTGWATHGGFGMIMLVANERGNGIYLLAHLSGIADGIERHSRVAPGDLVAYVGGSGGNLNFNPTALSPHLHLEYYDVQYNPSMDTDDDRNRYVVAEDNQQINPPRELTLQRQGQGQLPLSNRRNPFDHEERWIQV